MELVAEGEECDVCRGGVQVTAAVASDVGAVYMVVVSEW